MKNKKIIKWLALIAWLIVIFLLSNQPNSGQATYSFIERLIPSLKGNEIVELINLIIRKLAHITEFFILTFLIYQLLKEYKVKVKNIRKYSLILCFIFACLDELHQSQVIGRTGIWTDCLIDTFGGYLFIIITKKRLKK